MVSPGALAVSGWMRNLLRYGPASSRHGALTLASDARVVKRRCSLRPGMQHVDRPAHIQPFPEPAGACRSRSEAQAVGVVTRPERPDGIPRHRSRQRHLGQRVAIGPLEPESPVRPARDVKSLLVDSAVVPTAQQREIRQRGWAPLRPVLEVMALTEPDPTARKPAAPVPMVQRPP